MKEADYPRGDNRRLINELFNGFPPYTEQEAADNNIAVNVNFLEATRLGHDARSQFTNAITKPGNFFTLRTDMGPKHKRSTFGAVVTRAINSVMKKSLPYFEFNRSKFASLVLHGIGPGPWPDQNRWCPKQCGIEDVLIPGNILVGMEDLSFFALYKSISAPELLKLTRRPNVDPGWNMELVRKCLDWIDSEGVRLMGSNWPEIWAPEKLSERVKSDGGFYSADQLPKVDCFDFYFYHEDENGSGWRRRIILDSWGLSEMATRTGQASFARKSGTIYQGKEGFLYNGGTRKFASKREEIIGFQFADLSAVSPFRYHSVRSLGFLLYALCHLQNRLRCRFTEAVLEALMMYFRVKTMDDAQRALKIELVNRGLIEEGISMVPANERYQVNSQLVQLGLLQNQQLINENSSSYVQQPNYSQGGVEKTKFQVMAETNAMTSLVSAAFSQSYIYQTFEYLEIVRRFFKPNSGDVDIQSARATILKAGIPNGLLQVDFWDCEPERVMGAGNKTLEMTIANQLMQWRDKFDPEPQRKILRDTVLAFTDDPGRADELVPEEPVKVTDSVHDAQLTAGTLLQGLPVAVKTGMNHIEYVETLLVSMAFAIQKARTRGNMATPDELVGLQNLAQHISQHIEIIAQDEAEKERAKGYADSLGKLMNEVKAFAQRLQKQMEGQAQQGNGGMDEKDKAKIHATMATAKAKIQNTRESHAQRTAQRQIQFEVETAQRQQEHQLEMERKRAELQADVAAKRIQAQADAANSRMKAMRPTED